MSDKILRDELLRSHRYRTLSSDTTRLLFIHLLLCADALGNCEATTTAIGDAMGRPVDESTAAKWLSELSDVDIIRTYNDDGKRYVHIPRFRQRLRYPKGKHPRPPANLECIEIRELAEKVRPQSDLSQTTVRPQSDEVKRSEEKRREKRGTRIPDDWKPDPTLIAWATAARKDLNIPEVVERFRDYWLAKAGKDAAKMRWDLTFKTWVKNEKQFATIATDNTWPGGKSPYL